jgi:hypothetical protein
MDFLSMGAGLLDSAASLWGQRYANRSNVQQAENSREWSGMMSNTAHQREVADLNAAGLNPMLAATGGASTPQASTARVDNPVPNLAFSNALQALKVFSDIGESNARKEVALATVPKVVAETRSAVSNANVIDAVLEKQGALLGLQLKEREYQSPYFQDNAVREQNMREHKYAQEQYRTGMMHDDAEVSRGTFKQRGEAINAGAGLQVSDARIRAATEQAQIQTALTDAVIRGLDLPGAEAEAKAWRIGGAGRAGLRDAAGVASTFSSAASGMRALRERELMHFDRRYD